MSPVLFTTLFAYLRARIGMRHAAGDRGQATAEYALVLLGAAAVAMLLVTWAASSGKVGELVDAVFDSILGDI